MVDLSKNSHAAACRHSHYSVFRLLNEALWAVLGKNMEVDQLSGQITHSSKCCTGGVLVLYPYCSGTVTILTPSKYGVQDGYSMFTAWVQYGYSILGSWTI